MLWSVMASTSSAVRRHVVRKPSAAELRGEQMQVGEEPVGQPQRGRGEEKADQRRDPFNGCPSPPP